MQAIYQTAPLIRGRVRLSSLHTSGDYRTYEYDEYGQLVRENNQGLAKTYIYEYNDIGNLTAIQAYPFTLSTAPTDTPVTTTFGYTNDRLTSFGGAAIGYNAMGCPTSYEGKTATWSKGKLSRLSQGTRFTGMSTYNYGYNGYGQRISRSYSYTAGTSATGAAQLGQLTACNRNYYYDHAGRLIAEEVTKTYYGEGTTTENIVFLYDESCIIGMELTTGGVTNLYYFQRNLQGDVVAIYDTNGTLKAKYLYDAWGNCTISSETTSYDVANANPIRYRGYYYDDDTGLYYCNARYYSSKWRRFISPETGSVRPEVVNGLNLYIYASNCPTCIVYFLASTGGNVCGVMTTSIVGATNNIISGGVSHKKNMPHWVGSLLTGLSSVHGFVDSVSSYLAGSMDGLLSYIGAAKLNNFQSGLSRYSNWLMGIGIGLDVLSSAYSNRTNPNLTPGQKWASFGADVGYIAVKAGVSYVAGLGVTKGAVALGNVAMGAALGASIGGTTIGLIGAIAIGAGVVVLGVIAGTILIAVLSDAADNWWESKKEEWFS